jgi:hypothetical protein
MSAQARTYRVVAPRKDSEPRFWPRIGTAFQNQPQEGKSTPDITIRLDALPVEGTLLLYENLPAKEVAK